MTDVLEQARERLEESLERAEAYAQRDDFDPEEAAYRSIKDEITVRQRVYDDLADNEARRASMREAGDRLRRAQRASQDSDDARDRDQSGEGGTAGQIFTRSAAFAAYQASPMGTSSKVLIPGDRMLSRAPLTTVDGTGKPWQTPSRIGIALPSRQTPLLDLAQRVPVNSNAVEWVTYPAAAPLAGKVAEGSAKPEATITASVVTVTLDTIAHYAEATRQLLEDSPAAQAFIDGELRRGVLDKMEAEAAAALTGATLPAVAGASLMAAIRVAVGAVQDAGYQPDAVALNPADYAALDIEVFGSTMLGPVMSGSFWGLRPVPVGAVPAGTAFVGDFGAGLTYLERTGVALYITDSHNMNFTKNVFTLLAEARGKAVVTRAEAFAEATVTP